MSRTKQIKGIIIEWCKISREPVSYISYLLQPNFQQPTVIKSKFASSEFDEIS